MTAQTAERQALQRLHDWARAQTPLTDFSGDHPIAVAREVLANPRAVVFPRNGDVARMDDMHEHGHLRLLLDADGDVHVHVWDGDAGATVEFCAAGGNGGGRSSRTRLALIALMLAIEADNAEQPALDWWALRKAGQ